MSSSDVERNVALWTGINARYTDASAAEAWRREEMSWGMFHVPESALKILGDVAGLDCVELGCGTAYVSAWLARRGARAVGVDPTPAQLETARRLMRETGIEFELVEAPGEDVPLPDSAFDLAHSEHGAAAWADPYKWIPEAARLLRPGGRLVFVHTSPIATLCLQDVGEITTELQRPYFGMYRWDDDDGVDFNLTHGDWIALLRDSGFEIERLVELQAPPDAATHPFYSDIPAEWGRRWPGEEIWVARKQ
ncbi:MAG TPA: class I SAM-dependent methyltransferase [Gaiellaceae bacterium]|nr:class I SAM-dependent methyltransferase [Gaiellaceae bacterium]